MRYKFKYNLSLLRFLVCLVFGLCFVVDKSYIYGFGSRSHKTLTQLAMETTRMLDVFDADVRDRIEHEILDASIIPDYEEKGVLFKPHFYNPDTRIDGVEGYSAFSMMKQHFDTGVANWNVNQLSSVRELGMALHYMQDMCCIVHLNGYVKNIFLFPYHIEYEKAMDQKCSEYAVQIRKSEFAGASCYFREVFDISGAAAYSGKILGDYRNSKIDLKTPRFEQFKMTHQVCCELIYLFFKEVGINL